MDYFEDIGALPKHGKNLILTYILGFILSLITTLGAYWLVVHHIASGHLSPPDDVLTVYLIALALVQCAIQLVCFLHVSTHRDVRLKTMMFGFAFVVVVVLVGGSIWVMNHLNLRMMDDSQDQVNYVQTEDAF
jgi:cytochrome o ubiquinol oxidase operon protein cyoD